MSVLDGDCITLAAEFGDEYGYRRVYDQRVEGRIVGYLNRDRAWDLAKQIFTMLEFQFHEVEDMVRVFLVPVSGVHETVGLEPDEMAEQVIAAMKSTETVRFHIRDVGYSVLTFDGPACLSDTTVEVLFDESGSLLTIRFAP